MIEVIYDKDKEKDKQESNEKNEHEVSVNLRLPKNIRPVSYTHLIPHGFSL